MTKDEIPAEITKRLVKLKEMIDDIGALLKALYPEIGKPGE